MPKQRITKEMVVEAAFEIARGDGFEQVTVKRIAERLSCSVQPIYSYCCNMEGLRQEVAAQTDRFVHEYVAARINPDDFFAGTGKAYIQLAQEEPHLFKLFILHPRSQISSLKELYQSETTPQMADMIAAQLQLSTAQAQALHLHMLIYTIGIGTILSVTTPGIPIGEIYAQQGQAFQAFFRQTLAQGTDDECRPIESEGFS